MRLIVGPAGGSTLISSLIKSPIAQAAAVLLLAAVLYLALRRMQRKARACAELVWQKHPRSRVELFIEGIERTYRGTIAALALFFSAHLIGMPPKGMDIAQRLCFLLLTFQCAIWATMVIDRTFRAVPEHKGSDAFPYSVIGIGRALGVWVVWIIAILTALSSFGVNITALVTGLGIGGVAVALAVQNILADLFSSLSIMLDRPFEVGDFIQVGDSSGTVERIGLKTTRIRSITGEELVCSNSDLLKSRIRNFKRMFERRVMLSFSVVGSTKRETIAALPAKIRGILEERNKIRFDRAHLQSFGSTGLVFEVVYYVKSPSYSEYMDLQQEVNLSFLELFEQEGVSLTQQPVAAVAQPGMEKSDNSKAAYRGKEML